MWCRLFVTRESKLPLYDFMQMVISNFEAVRAATPDG